MSTLFLDKNESPLRWAKLDSLQIDGELIRRYPDESALVAAWAKDSGVDASNVVPTNGGDEAVELSMRWLMPKGARIVVCTPTFSTFVVLAERYGLSLIGVPYEQDGGFPAEQMLETIRREKPGGVILIDPNNPTGTPIPDGFTAAARAAIGAEGLVLLDRAYGEFAGRTDDAAMLASDERLVIIRSLSKCPGVAGLRVGALLGSGEAIETARARRMIFSVNSVSVAVGVEALCDTEGRAACVQRAKTGRDRLVEQLQALGLSPIKGPTNFVYVALGSDAAWAHQACARMGLVVRLIDSVDGFSAGLRITVGDSEQMDRAAAILGNVLRRRPLLLDMDGTLLDTSGSYHECLRKTVRQLADRAIDDSLVNDVKADAAYNDDHDAGVEILRRSGVDVDRAKVVEIFDGLYRGNGDAVGLRAVETTLVSDETLRLLAKRFTLGIVTGRPREDLDWALDHFGWRDVFAVRVDFEDCIPDRKKPHAWPLQEALRRLGDRVDPSMVRYVGDSAADRGCAEKAGLPELNFIPVGDLAHDESTYKTSLEPLGALQ